MSIRRMNLLEELMQFLMKPLREINMTNEKNQLIEQLSSIDNNLEKLQKNSNRISDNMGLIWLILVGYIIYIEFFK